MTLPEKNNPINLSITLSIFGLIGIFLAFIGIAFTIYIDKIATIESEVANIKGDTITDIKVENESLKNSIESITLDLNSLKKSNKSLRENKKLTATLIQKLYHLGSNNNGDGNGFASGVHKARGDADKTVAQIHKDE